MTTVQITDAQFVYPFGFAAVVTEFGGTRDNCCGCKL